LLVPGGGGDAKPNILWLMADDLGFADTGITGLRGMTTPHIDRVAKEGLFLRQSYSNSAVCSATRTGLITGRYQYRLRVGVDEPLGANPNVGLPSTHPTLPSQLRKAGYRTALVGTWHLGEGKDFGPLHSGYDRFYGILKGGTDYFRHTPYTLVDGVGSPLMDGDWKYLKLGKAEWLFNLADDEHERANYAQQEAARLAAMKQGWAAWNATMLPYPADSTSAGNVAADRY
jgi:arylsulfatase A-like enzyme